MGMTQTSPLTLFLYVYLLLSLHVHAWQLVCSETKMWFLNKHLGQIWQCRKDNCPVGQLVFTVSLCFHKHIPNRGLNKAAKSVHVYSIILNSLGARWSRGMVILLLTATFCPLRGQHQVDLAHVAKNYLFSPQQYICHHITSSSWTCSHTEQSSENIC